MSSRISEMDMLLDLQKLVSKNIEIIQSMADIISILSERVMRLEEKIK